MPSRSVLSGVAGMRNREQGKAGEGSSQAYEGVKYKFFFVFIFFLFFVWSAAVFTALFFFYLGIAILMPLKNGDKTQEAVRQALPLLRRQL